MTGKGDGRLHARQQCSDEEMQANWDRIFKKPSVTVQVDGAPIEELSSQPLAEGVTGVSIWADKCHFTVRDELAGDGDTFEEKVSLSDEMQLHGDKHKPEGL